MPETRTWTESRILEVAADLFGVPPRTPLPELQEIQGERPRVGDLLVAKGLLTVAQLDRVLDRVFDEIRGRADRLAPVAPPAPRKPVAADAPPLLVLADRLDQLLDALGVPRVPAPANGNGPATAARPPVPATRRDESETSVTRPAVAGVPLDGETLDLPGSGRRPAAAPSAEAGEPAPGGDGETLDLPGPGQTLGTVELPASAIVPDDPSSTGRFEAAMEASQHHAPANTAESAEAAPDKPTDAPPREEKSDGLGWTDDSSNYVVLDPDPEAEAEDVAGPAPAAVPESPLEQPIGPADAVATHAPERPTDRLGKPADGGIRYPDEPGRAEPVAVVRGAPAVPDLWVVCDPFAPAKLPADRDFAIGRFSGCDLALPVGMVSRHHATIAWRDGAFHVFDLGSENGTYVNEKRVQRAPLAAGDTIRINPYVIEVRGEAPANWQAEAGGGGTRYLSPTDTDARGGISGKLSETQLPDVLHLLGIGRKTGELKIRSGTGRGRLTGSLFCSDGEVVDARCGELEGEPAFQHLVGLADGTFVFAPGGEPPARTITRRTHNLLLDAMRAAASGPGIDPGETVQVPGALVDAWESATVSFTRPGAEAAAPPEPPAPPQPALPTAVHSVVDVQALCAAFRTLPDVETMRALERLANDCRDAEARKLLREHLRTLLDADRVAAGIEAPRPKGDTAAARRRPTGVEAGLTLPDAIRTAEDARALCAFLKVLPTDPAARRELERLVLECRDPEARKVLREHVRALLGPGR